MSDGEQMSFRHRWVLRVGEERGVSEGARLMGIMAINRYGKPHRGTEFWPSHKALADLVGVSERTAERRMNELVMAGLIEKRSGGFQQSNRYVATLPKPGTCDGIGVANPDTAVGIETSSPDSGDTNPDSSDTNPDTSVGPIPTAVSVEHIQEHLHLNISIYRPSDLEAPESEVEEVDVWEIARRRKAAEAGNGQSEITLEEDEEVDDQPRGEAAWALVLGTEIP